MAKQCIYCGQLLAKEDARFCNDCGQSQVLPARASADGGAAPSAIKVRLPPKEFSRTDSAAARRETSVPGISASVVSPAREATPPSSSRMPKRPVRLAPSESSTQERTEEKREDDAPVLPTRPPGSVPPASNPTPAEELSTMVLPNWREELARLRQEQEQASKATTPAPEKAPERPSKEPPPLPRRPLNPSPIPREADAAASPLAQPRPPSGPIADAGSGVRAPEERVPSAELPRRLPNTPVPRESTRPADGAQRSSTPPAVPSDPAATEIARRELRVKVWQQDGPPQPPQTPRPREEPPVLKPAPAVEQNPFAAPTPDDEKQEIDIEERETLQWQTPLSPLPAGPSPSFAPAEKPVAGKAEAPQPIEDKDQTVSKGEVSASREEKEQTARTELRPPVDVPPVEVEEQPGADEQPGDDIEDLPTMHLAVPETARPAAQIQIERASTPRKRPEPSVDEVEDLPTRPLAASPAASPTPPPRSPSAPVLPPGQSGERRPEQVQGPGNPASLPGVYAPPPAARAPESAADPLASRGRPGNPASLPGTAFNPPSLPGGPLSMPGNTPLGPIGPGAPRAATPFPDISGQRSPQSSPDAFAQRPPQRPPAFESAPPAQSMQADASKQREKSVEQALRNKRKTGRVLAVCLALALIVGVAAWVILYQPFTVDQSTQPYWNYQDKALGISVDYTSHWNINVDKGHTMARFLDNTKTGQVTLISAPASGQLADYLNQQETRLGMSGKQARSPATFAGATWQVVEGTVVQEGATYTMTIYAAQHGNHFYLLEFQAPPSSYKIEDQNSFAHMRSSLQFL